MYIIEEVKLSIAVLPDNIDLDNFLALLNRLSTSIKFTIEKESNNSIPFLDVEAIRGENNRPQFNPLVPEFFFSSFFET